jgi:hypothetical protein
MPAFRVIQKISASGQYGLHHRLPPMAYSTHFNTILTADQTITQVA